MIFYFLSFLHYNGHINYLKYERFLKVHLEITNEGRQMLLLNKSSVFWHCYQTNIIKVCIFLLSCFLFSTYLIRNGWNFFAWRINKRKKERKALWDFCTITDWRKRWKKQSIEIIKLQRPIIETSNITPSYNWSSQDWMTKSRRNMCSEIPSIVCSFCK